MTAQQETTDAQKASINIMLEVSKGVSPTHAISWEQLPMKADGFVGLVIYIGYNKHFFEFSPEGEMWTFPNPMEQLETYKKAIEDNTKS